MMAAVEPLRIVFSELRKDSLVRAAQVERHTGVSRDDPERYRLAVLALRTEIEAQCGILSRQVGDDIRLMTDAEADGWNARNARLGRNAIARSVERAALIDVGQLSNAERRDHAARVERSNAWQQALLRCERRRRDEPWRDEVDEVDEVDE